MAHRENWEVINYGQRGRRGYPGRGVTSIQMDSEGMITAYYTDNTSEGVGKVPSGPQGEPGQNGKIVDVIVNGESVVTSEGIAYITASSEGQTYEAGDGINIEGNVISASIDDMSIKFNSDPDEGPVGLYADFTGIVRPVEPLYNMSGGPSIGGDVVLVYDDTLELVDVEGLNGLHVKPEVMGEDVQVTVDVGNYLAGDVIPASETLRDVIKNLLYKETPPVPPVQDTWYWWASNDVPTEIPASASSKAIDAEEVKRTGLVQYFTTSRQYATCAFPASMGNLTSIIESDFMDVLDLWTRVETIKDGVPYLIYYNVKTKSTDIKEEFKWR